MKRKFAVRRACLGLVVLCSVWLAALQARADDFADKLAAFQNALEAARAELDFPGATAAFVLSDGRSGVVSVGVADRASGVPMSPQARMMSGSTGKTYTAATALALSGEGRLDLDAPITRYLGEPDWLTGLPNWRRITTRHLLMHRSGLQDHIDLPSFQMASIERALATPDDALTPIECIRFLNGYPALFAPGRGYAYSDTNYLLAGLVIEAVGDAPYYDQVRARFFDPLALTLTGAADHRRLPGLAQGYPVWPDGADLPATVVDEEGALLWNPRSEWAGGGFITNAHDAARWAWRLYGGTAMAGDYVPELVRAQPEGGESTASYGLGVEVARGAYGLSYGHSGYFPGYRSSLVYWPELGIAVAFQINTERDVRSGRVINGLRERLLAALLEPPH